MMERYNRLAALALLGGGAIPQVESTEKHASISGNICGWDNGRDRKKQPRNAECLCGSGKKAKRCCVFEPKKGE